MSIEETLIEEETTLPTPDSVEAYYGRLRLLVESMESDALKSNKGNKQFYRHFKRLNILNCCTISKPLASKPEFLQSS